MPNPAKKADPAADRRKKARYAISPSFPLKVVLALSGEAGQDSGRSWKDWPGTLVDLSASGAHIQVNLAAVAFPDSHCRIRLSLGTFKLELPGTIAHFVCSSRYGVCGVHFDFPDPGIEKAYLRVLEPVIIGASLAPVEATPGYSRRHKEEYGGKISSLLTVWRETPGSEVSGFDFRMNRYGVEWERVPGGDAGARLALRFKLSSAEKTAGGEPPVPLAETQEAEARWLFRLAASNLSPSVAADVRKLLLSLV